LIQGPRLYLPFGAEIRYFDRRSFSILMTILPYWNEAAFSSGKFPMQPGKAKNRRF
jgi:hypothetical protein